MVRQQRVTFAATSISYREGDYAHGETRRLAGRQV
jgi:hypothetical protein